MFLESLTAIFASSGAGAIIGAVGSFFTKRENRLREKQLFAHDEKMASIETEQIKLEHSHALDLADKNIEQAQVEGAIEKDVAETAAFAQSLEVQKVKSGIGFVDGIRFLMRPLITVYLLAIASYFAYNVHQVVDGLEALSVTAVIVLYTQIISQIMFLTTTAVTWWFGSRGS